LAEQYGEDLGVSCRVFALWLLWQLGYPEQAVQHARTVRTIAEALSHPFSLAQALSFGGQLHSNLGAVQQVREMSDALTALCRERDFALWQASSMGLHGWALVEEGRGREGIVELRQGIADWRATGAEIWLPLMRAMLAEAYGKIGQPQEGLAVIEEALTATRGNGEAWYNAELNRLKGELTLQFKVPGSKFKVTDPRSPIPDPQGEAEAYFFKALEIARQQEAKSLELRAVMSLTRLWRQQGKSQEAQPLLQEIYGWFREGFDTADLKEAKALLDELYVSVPSASRTRTKPTATKSTKRKSR
jgi:predicted ATPase